MKNPREILLKQHRLVEPKLDRMWDQSLAPTVAAVYDRRGSKRNVFVAAIWTLWHELVLPSRRIWAGLASAWALIIILNLASSEPTRPVAAGSKPHGGEEVRALIEQRQMLAQLIGPLAEPDLSRKRNSTGPRSERVTQISVV